MFTGIIKDVGIIKSIDLRKSNNIKIKTSLKKICLGDSISCSGICLTVYKKDTNSFWVNVSSETVKKTNIKGFSYGQKINLEQSLRMGDELGGHLVFGHVDYVSKVKNIKKIKDSHEILFSVEKKISKFLVSKGSISIDGVSLTINKVTETDFSVNIIPYTWENTSFKNIKIGDLVNTEVDMLARYALKAMEVWKK
tara:strand:- start:771 stop:1358 length:588 start_codon:yes stop_codon:yes gene_type:complete